MCEALKISSADVHDLDATLAKIFTAKTPEGFEFIGAHTEGTGKYNYILWAHAVIGDGDREGGIHRTHDVQQFCSAHSRLKSHECACAVVETCGS